MKFTVSQKVLVAALSRAVSISPSKSTIPILETVLLELKGNALRLTATDLSCTVVVTLVVAGIKNGAVAVPVKKLFALVKALPQTDLIFSRKGEGKIGIETASGKYEIASFSAEDFPVTQEMQPKVEFEYDAELFAQRASTVAFAVSTDELRNALLGMLLDVRPDELRFVATDGHRLAKVCDLNFISEQSTQAIIPTVALDFIARHAVKDERMKVALNAEVIRFQFEKTTLMAHLLNASYPNYERVIPQDCALAINNIDAAELLSALRRALPFAQEHTKRVVLHLAQNALRVEAEQQGGDASREHIAVHYSVEDGEVTIGCNAEYLMANLAALNAERFVFRLHDANSAMLFEPQEQAEGEHRMTLLMPIRLE